jgi:raffinose/stachyose/melibiose transport system permease protein
MVWKWMYEPSSGPLNYYLSLAGIAPQRFLIDSSQALWCVMAMTVWKETGYAMVMYMAGMTGIPGTLYEAAEMDGCTRWQTFWKIVFPLLKPTIATVAIIDAMAFWNDYLLPSLVLTKKNLYTIPIATQAFYGTYSTDIGLVMAALLLAMAPILILYVFLQKYIVEGVTSGAVKG